MDTDQHEQLKVLGTCHHDCPDACSIITTVIDGVATGVRGNPEHPFTRGGLCAKVNDFEKRVYHEDRILYPGKRLGPKGSGQFERISWDEAVDTICSRFKEISDTHGSEAILPTGYLGNEHILNGLNVMDPFMHRVGASVIERTFCTSVRGLTYGMIYGPAVIDPEGIVNARYIICWGHNPMTSHIHLMPFILAARKAGAKLVVIDPYENRTAKRADWHIKIKPGTDGALALGMMYVIITEGLTDEDFVENHTEGFEQLKERALAFPPERVERITGIPAEDVRTLAREYANAKVSNIRVGTALENKRQGGQTFRLVYSLPALVGAWRMPGGGTHELTLAEFPVQWAVLSQVQWRKPNPQTVNGIQLGRALTGELDLRVPIKALMVMNGNPVVTVPEQDKLKQGLARDDLFTVVADHFISDTARYADIFLPATTLVEHFDLAFSWGHLYLGANNPAIEPLGEALPNVEMFRRLAKGMGFDDPWFRMSDEEMAKVALDWAAPQLDGITLEELREKGWARLNLPGPDAAPFANGGFPTPNGRAQLVSHGMEDMVPGVFRQGYEGEQGGKLIPDVPDYIEEDVGEYLPLRLITPRGHHFISSQYANIERQSKAEGPQRVLLHPDAAATRGITEGQEVVVFNENGQFFARCDLDPKLQKDSIVSRYGFWASRTTGEATVQAVIPAELTDMGRGGLYQDARVDVRVLVDADKSRRSQASEPSIAH